MNSQRTAHSAREPVPESLKPALKHSWAQWIWMATVFLIRMKSLVFFLKRRISEAPPYPREARKSDDLPIGRDALI